MNQKVTVTFAACVFLAGIIQFFACLGGPYAAAAGVVIGLLAIGLQRFFEVELTQPYWLVVPPVAGSALGVLLFILGSPSDPAFWLAPGAAGLTTGLFVWWQLRDTRRCPLCDARVAGVITLGCPRCHLQVCEQCWSHEKLRCRLCVQNAVPLFPDSKQWWDRNIGLTTKQGRCQICQADTEQAELRACRKCGRPQCLECWDDANGICARCHTRPGEVPAELAQLLPEETRK